jgi:iron complex transport system substrate-binding protein
MTFMSKASRAFVWLAVAAWCGGAAIGCRAQPSTTEQMTARDGTPLPAASTPFPRTVKDAFGDPLTLNEPPKRIVSQTLGTDEILFAICPPERIAGISSIALDTSYSKIADEAKARGTTTIYGPEDILALKPDLVFIASYSRSEMATLLRAAHAPVYRFSNFDRVEDIANNVLQLGYLIGRDAAAARVVMDMNERMTRARAQAAASGRRPRIMTYDGSGYSAGSATLFDDVIRQAGGVNVSAEHGTKGFGRVSGEQILEWQPEYLICGAKPGEEDVVRRRLMANPAIATSTAVKSGRLILMDTRVFMTTSHHVVTAVEALVNALHGDGTHPALARPKPLSTPEPAR